MPEEVVMEEMRFAAFLDFSRAEKYREGRSPASCHWVLLRTRAARIFFIRSVLISSLMAAAEVAAAREMECRFDCRESPVKGKNPGTHRGSFSSGVRFRSCPDVAFHPLPQVARAKEGVVCGYLFDDHEDERTEVGVVEQGSIELPVGTALLDEGLKVKYDGVVVRESGWDVGRACNLWGEGGRQVPSVNPRSRSAPCGTPRDLG